LSTQQRDSRKHLLPHICFGKLKLSFFEETNA
jgi:hypothetical protein